MPTLHVLRVFVNEDGEWGNPLGVFLRGAQVPEPHRQRIATELGFSETVFIDDSDAGLMRIYTPQVELPFAGHPTVGAAWLLAKEGVQVKRLRPPAGEVNVRYASGAIYVAARPEWAPSFEYIQLDSPGEVRALTASAAGANTYAWAWIDEAAGTIRARSFVPEAGITEDEATGSAALALCARLGHPITIHQGHGSILLAQATTDGWVEVGGKVTLDEVREQEIRSVDTPRSDRRTQ
ncbi:MAG TPA: PhzF family phenazine biosynthesis protein [Solirubrobacterales bacterium]|nr:PhzF family phenazine biosynthesis protein [Solirubrobacterales bacterium]